MIGTQKEIFNISSFRGLNCETVSSQIEDSEAAEMLNFELDEKGALNKRRGYTEAYSLPAGSINGLIEYKGKMIAAVNDMLFEIRGEAPVKIYTGIANVKISFVQTAGKLFILDGTNYLSYDGQTVRRVDQDVYTPMISVSNLPTGGGESLEDFNLLNRFFKMKYSGDGESTVYSLPSVDLGADLLEIIITDTGITTMTEGTGFTVDRDKKEITFDIAPAKGINNVEVKAALLEDRSDRVKGCTQGTLYGGSNDTRIFLYGHGEYPSRIIRSGITDKGFDETYFPENDFQEVGANDKVIKLVKQYDTVIVIKETSMYQMTYQLTDQGTIFPVKPVNDVIGAINPHVVQILNNDPVVLNDKGVYILTQSNVRDERNVQRISNRIWSKMVNEDLKSAHSYEIDHKYYICINEKVFIFDYNLQEWYIWDNIPATCYLRYNSLLYFGSTDGKIYRFRQKEEELEFSDNGTPIKAVWKSKLLNFGTNTRRKTVRKLFLNVKSNTRSSFTATYFDDNNQKVPLERVSVDLYSYLTFDYSRMTYICSAFPQEVVKKIKAKKIIYFQIQLENDEPNDSLGITAIDIEFRLQNQVKK